MPTVRTVRVWHDETVNIVWEKQDETVTTTHKAPPGEAWKAKAVPRSVAVAGDSDR